MTSKTSQSSTNKPTLNLIRLSEVEAKPVRWLWPGFIPKGKLSMLVGHPGQGKSTLTAEIAAIVSAGRKWPVSGMNADVGEVLILSAEDEVADTIKPRVMAAGGDVDKVTFLDSVAISDTRERSFNLSKDLEKLEELDTDLLIIDPISSYLSGIDTHNNADVRSYLGPLIKLMERKNLTVLCVSHLNKSEQIDAISRVSGSMAFVAIARSVHILIPDPKNAEKRLLFPLKNNLGRDQDGFAFSIQSRTLEGGIYTSSILWEDEYVPKPEGWGPQDKPKTALERAKDFLADLLREKPYPANEVRDLTIGAGHSEATIRRAADELGIRKSKVGMDGGWTWFLPDDTAEGVQDAQDEDASLMNTFEETEHLREVNGRS
jgi:putative DNA primase/helicase